METFPELCECGHDATEHANHTGRCRGLDSYGQRCDCPSLEPWPEDDEE